MWQWCCRGLQQVITFITDKLIKLSKLWNGFFSWWKSKKYLGTSFNPLSFHSSFPFLGAVPAFWPPMPRDLSLGSNRALHTPAGELSLRSFEPGSWCRYKNVLCTSLYCYDHVISPQLNAQMEEVRSTLTVTLSVESINLLLASDPDSSGLTAFCPVILALYIAVHGEKETVTAPPQNTLESVAVSAHCVYVCKCS